MSGQIRALEIAIGSTFTEDKNKAIAREISRINGLGWPKKSPSLQA